MSNPTLVHGKRQSLGKTIWKHRASYLLMAPYFILFFFFTVLPVLMAIGVSFTDWNMLEKPEFVGWQNYVKLLLDDEIFIISLKNTLIFAVITGPVSYMLCLLFAWIINEFNRGMRTLLTLIFYAPSICGNAYMVWNLILTGDRYGYLNGILLNLDIINEPILWMKTEQYVMPMLIIVQLWLSLGTGFLSFIAGLQTVDKSMYEAAAIDGCGPVKILYKIICPMLSPSLVACALFQFMWSCNDFMGPLLYVTTPRKYPMAIFVKLSMDSTSEGIQWNRILALSLISIIPQLLVFFAAQDSFIDGIAAGSVKG